MPYVRRGIKGAAWVVLGSGGERESSWEDLQQIQGVELSGDPSEQ